MKNLLNSFKFAFAGIVSSFKSEKNMKIHIAVMVLVIICGFIFKLNISEWITCVISFGIVIGSELFNTAIETIVDMISPEYNEKAKLAKDLSAGAVLVFAISSAIVGLLIFIPKIITL